jgi:prevent-host-death family protein
MVNAMRISVTDAKTRLTELVRLAEGGDDVVLTHDGRPIARLVPIASPDRAERRRIMEAISRRAASKATAGEPAARSQDFLYGDE